MFKLLITKENICGFEIALLAFLSVLPLINISNTGIEQLALSITLGVLLLMFLQNIRVLGKRLRFLIIYLNAASIIITVCFHGGFGSAVMAMNLILAAMIYNNIEINQTIYVRLHLFLAVALTFYIATADISYIWTTVVTDLFGNTFNSNMFAMFTLAAYLHWICFLFESRIRGWKRNTAFIVLSVFSIYLIWISESRTAIIAVLLFLFLFFFKKNAFGNREFHVLTVLSLILSCVFPIIYVALANKFAGVTVLGKSLFSGRQDVWKSTFNIIKEHPIFGSANEILLHDVGGKLTMSTHNMMLGLMKMFGIVPSVTVVQQLVNNNSNADFGVRMKIPQFAFIATIPCAFFESFYTNSHLYMLFAFFLLEFIMIERNS